MTEMKLTTRHRYWHFLPENKKLANGDNREVKVGKTIRHSGKLVMCQSGLHASYRAIDTLRYAPGPIVCRVRLGGELIVGDDKVVAAERTVIAMADATTLLHEFACWCATQALTAAKVTDDRCWAAVNTKLKWLRGEATDDELSAAYSAACSAAESAAESAAYSAAWAAARSAAESAARSAAESAAESAAWSEACSAAESAAESAARSAHNTHLEQKLRELLRGEYERA